MSVRESGTREDCTVLVYWTAHQWTCTNGSGRKLLLQSSDAPKGEYT